MPSCKDTKDKSAKLLHKNRTLTSDEDILGWKGVVIVCE
jgi:hypothetical protein